MQPKNFKDLTNQRFGLLLVTKRLPDKSGKTFWECICDCGTVCTALSQTLQRKNRPTNSSCGCQRKIAVSISAKKRFTKHGKAHTRVYRCWKLIIRRCYKKADNEYHRYGALGITVCPEWNTPTSFPQFFKDMGEQPSAEHQIDRIDPAGNYNKENCRWATPKENSRNKRNNRILPCFGENLCLSAMAEKYKIHISTLMYRLNVLKLTAEEAVTRSVNHKLNPRFHKRQTKEQKP